MQVTAASVQEQIQQKVTQALSVEYFLIANESHLHRSGPEAYSHFKLTVVSSDFSGQLPVKRHQMIYGLLADELAGPVHALALHTYTPEEWASVGQAPDSPNCGGGH